MQIGARAFKGWWRPGSQPILDRNHPLAFGIRCYIAAGLSGSLADPDLASNTQAPFLNVLKNSVTGYSFPNTLAGTGLRAATANGVQAPAGNSLTRTSVAAGTGTFTVAFMAKFNTIAGTDIVGQSIGSSSPDCGFFWNSAGTMAFFTQGTQIIAATPTVVAGSMHVFVATRDPANAVTVYQDGVVIATGSSTQVVSTSASQIYIGNYGGFASGTTDVTHLAIAGWDRNLSSAEVSEWSADPFGLLVFPEDQIAATLVGVTTTASPLPFNQVDWPKALRVAKAPFDLSVATNLNLFKNPIPFSQYDWSKPSRVPNQPPAEAKSLNLNLFKNPIPFSQYDWSKPFRVPNQPPTPLPLNQNLFHPTVSVLPFNQMAVIPVFGVPHAPFTEQPYNQSLLSPFVVLMMGQAWM